MRFRITILFFLFCLLFISSVFAADWNLAEKVGYWELDERTNFKSGWNDDECTLAYNTSISNFTAWTITIDTEIFQDPTWITTHEYIVLALIGATGQEFRIQGHNWRDVGINFFGLAMTFQGCDLKYWVNDTWNTLDSSSVIVDWVFRIFKSGTTTLTLQAEGYVDAENCAVNGEINFEVPEGWFQTVELWFEADESSWSLFGFDGQIRGQITDEHIYTNLPPISYTLQNKTQWQQTLIETIWQALRGAFKPFQPVSDFLGQLWNFLSYAGNFLGTMFTQVNQFIPLIIGLFGFWIIFFSLECFMDFNLKPIIELFIGIYQFFANLISMFVNVAQTIYEYLKFW